MKKGDIVQLRQGWTLERAALRERDAINLRAIDQNTIPATLTVSYRGTESVCCNVYNIVKFDELPGITFTIEQFEVALLAGEPDVNELLKESKKRELAWIGF